MAKGRVQTPKQEDPKPARHPLLGRLLLLLGSIVAGLVIGEVVVRLSGRAPHIIPIGVSSDRHVYRRSTNPILSYEFKPGFRSGAKDLPFDYRVINSHGFRDIERQHAKPPGTKRIILLGDSVVVGYGIDEIDQLMSRQLEMLYGEENVEVLNMAITGYCTRSEVEMLRVRGVQYDPDLVILVFVENDFRNFNPESLGMDGIASRSPALNGLFRSSHAFRLACVRFNWFGFGLEASPADWNQKAIGDNNVVEGLKLFRELADQYGFRPLVAVWPSFTTDAIEYPAKMFMPGSDELIVERIAHAHGLPVAGLREPFLAHLEKLAPRPIPRQHYTTGDEMHPSVAGHRAAAEILHTVIAGRSLLDATSAQTGHPGRGPDDDTAIRAARALGAEKAGYGLVHYNKAVDLYQVGQFDEAVKHLEKVTPADLLSYGDASVMLASIYFQQGKRQAAIARLQELLQLNPNHFDANMLMADALMSAKKIDRAIEHLKRAAFTAPERYEPHHFLGRALGRGGRWQEALPHMIRAAKLAPDNVRVSNDLAAVLTNVGRKQDAIRQFRHSLRLEPGNRKAREGLQSLGAPPAR